MHTYFTFIAKQLPTVVILLIYTFHFVAAAVRVRGAAY